VRSADDRDGADSYLNSVGVIGDASWTSHGSTLFVWLKKPRVPIGGIERRPRRGSATYSRTNRVPGTSLGDVMHRAGRAPDLPATSKMVDVPPDLTLNCISRAAEARARAVERSTPSHHLVQHGAEGEDVGAGIRRPSLQLFRASYYSVPRIEPAWVSDCASGPSFM
jgi:hypothetical protein